jgi:hypothetical protein
LEKDVLQKYQGKNTFIFQFILAQSIRISLPLKIILIEKAFNIYENN